MDAVIFIALEVGTNDTKKEYISTVEIGNTVKNNTALPFILSSVSIYAKLSFGGYKFLGCSTY